MASSTSGFPESRKVYQAPTLRIYGDVGDITQNVGMTGNGDGGTGNDKSSKL